MKSVESYRGREQTYLKHFFLERYLERVAYIIGWFYPEFVYVDGFSGPWRSASEEFGDTSFIIALQKLRQVRAGLAERGREVTIRCLFIERDPARFEALRRATETVPDFEIRVLNGEFEDSVDEILDFAGSSFSLTFIDPTGWTGFGLRQIEPILQHQPGEVLVNFMFDQLNRFLLDSRPRISNSFDSLFGGPGWEHAVQAGPDRERAVIQLYQQRMKSTGKFQHVTSTRILKPISDRAYFHLIYGTRHIKGLREFRRVEREFVTEQERVRAAAKDIDYTKRTGQITLFEPSERGETPSFLQDRASNLAEAENRLRMYLQGRSEVDFESVLSVLLEIPLVWEKDIQEILRSMKNAGEIEVLGMKPRERTFKRGHTFLKTK